MHDTAINCWNTATEYGPNSIEKIAQDPTTLQFASGVKVKELYLIFHGCVNN